MSLLLYIVLATISTQIPVIKNLASLIDTAIHESGHVFAAFMTSGKAKSMELNADGSGSVTIQGGGTLGRIFFFSSGYTFSSFFSYLSLQLFDLKYYSAIIFILAFFYLLAVLFFIEKFSFGFLWGIGVLSILGYAYFYGGETMIHHVVMFFVSLQVVYSFKASIEIFLVSLLMPHTESDVKQLKEVTYIPTVFWGVVFLLFGIFMFLSGIKFWL
ncbi:M50 family metallopeptidase [Bacillus badius]|uniref:M50 family metallopeptidase n=1 Tax=Bacillus badius TaxID=1455 RepID=UPI0007B396D8|nr:M50 family metallopeptidase [Bacillus badius]KZR56944.1 hypothetical protein A3781_20400 [Bacillus badius]